VRRWPALGSQAGFTLIEVLVATLVLTTGLVATLGALNITVRTSRTTLAREGATSLAREILEDARTIPYAQLSPSSLESQLQTQNGLTNTTPGAGWHITRRGVTYTASASECAIDDPKDGYGVHEKENGQSVFCPESTTEGTEDKTPADMKRITATVTWTIRGRAASVTQVQTLTATGEAIGLSASELRLTSPSFAAPKNKEPVITEPTTATLSFAAKAPEGTTAMSWSLEGVRQSPAPVKQSGTEWTFSWTISEPLQKVYVSDGTYVVSAQAINSAGVDGPVVSIPVTLIRGTPAAPAGVKGGFNSVYEQNKPFKVKVAELQWQGNSERNVIGYRVHSPAGALVCPESEATLSLARSCIDLNPPAPSASASERTYTATALYRNTEGTVLEGPAAKFTLPTETTAPNAPAEVKLTKNPDGSVTLTWPAPPGGGPAVAFYRVYRGSHAYTDRYGVAPAGASTVTFTDTDAVEPHAYWVTAVDENLTESELVGPVEG
jgi:prepilin-type N-terminal cleavage/methylation domain-containing protein